MRSTKNAGKNEPGALSGRKKAAILLLAIGPESASEVYRNLTDQEIEQLTLEIANVGNVTNDQIAQVVEEFYHTAMAKQYISYGGIGTARDILEKALGPGKAMEIIEHLQGILTGHPFDFLKHVDPDNLFNFVQHEHPQTIALILAHLTEEQAAVILSALPPELQHEVALRIATMDQTSPEIISDIERVLEKKLSNLLSQEYSVAGGVDSLADLLNRLDQNSSQTILERIEAENQELASELKKQMFTFNDIVLLDDRTLQKMLQRVDSKDLMAALKGAREDVKEMILRNMSSRAAQMLKEDIETMGPIRVKAVEESQQRIIEIMRRMEESGEIQIHRAGNDDYVE
ncbi:MAG: flagellar motor switch protein FliG [Candidatus Omnitrophota bacterium]